ncbi:MAG: chloramphenicol acetyltransferase CAT, partial [Clostridia bacterium]|nr:chloramphenicol acetyltransferase CAT [Clostridia bacterium]
MDKFKPIDINTWPRAEEYRLFTEKWSTICYTVTVKVSVQNTVSFLKEKGIKFVPAILWLITRELQKQENFMLAVKDGKLGKWEAIHPMYPVINSTGNITFH